MNRLNRNTIEIARTSQSQVSALVVSKREELLLLSLQVIAVIGAFVAIALFAAASAGALT